MSESRIDTFKQMLESDPDNALVRFGLANEYLKAELYEEAIAALNDYLRRADDEGAAFGMLARALEKRSARAGARGLSARDRGGQPARPSLDGRGLPDDA